MKILKDEIKAILLFLLMLFAVGTFIYFLATISPVKETAEDECEVGCPIHALCPPGCKK